MAKKKKKSNHIALFGTIFAVVGIWLTLPVIAGMFQIGEPAGPKIYPAPLHHSLYNLGATAAGHGKAHQSLTSFFYERPWFYGMKKRTIIEVETEAAWDKVSGKTDKWMDNQ